MFEVEKRKKIRQGRRERKIMGSRAEKRRHTRGKEGMVRQWPAMPILNQKGAADGS